MEPFDRGHNGRAYDDTGSGRTAGGTFGRAVLFIAIAWLFVLVKQNVLPDVQRYLKMRSM